MMIFSFITMMAFIYGWYGFLIYVEKLITSNYEALNKLVERVGNPAKLVTDHATIYFKRECMDKIDFFRQVRNVVLPIHTLFAIGIGSIIFLNEEGYVFTSAFGAGYTFFTIVMAVCVYKTRKAKNTYLANPLITVP